MKRPFSIKLRLPLTVALVAGLFSSLQRLVAFTSVEWLNVAYAFSFNFVFMLLLWGLGAWLDTRFSLWTKVIILYISGLLTMSAVIYFMNEWWQQSLAPVLTALKAHRLEELQSIRSTTMWLIRLQIMRSFTLITAVLLLQYTLKLFLEKQRVELENERLKQESLNAQLEAIRQQINPHFFFNTLNTLKTLVKNSQPIALPYIIQLSNVFRYLLRLQQQQWVVLSEELNFLKAYLFLLQIRFGDGLHVRISLPDSLLNSPIPPATLQLLLENAVKHNVVSASRPLQVSIGQKDENHLFIENTLQPKRSPEPSNQYGLHSLNNRYRYLCGQGIDIVRNESVFRVELPIIENESVYEGSDHRR